MMPEKPYSYYNKVYSEPYPDERYLPVYELVYEWAGKPERVFDAGCGIGGIFYYWPDPKPKEMAGMDFSSKAIDIAAKRVPSACWACGDLNCNHVGILKHGKPMEFDLCVCVEVLEHLEKDMTLFGKLKDLAPRIIASVPSGDTVPCEAHVDRSYDPAVIERRYGVMNKMKCVKANKGEIIVFEWQA